MTELRKAAVEFLTPAQAGSCGAPRLSALAPCISRGFEAPPPPPLPDHVPTPDVSEINALGIMLVELCFGKPIEDYHTRWDPDRHYVTSDAQKKMLSRLNFVAAIEWKEDIVGEAGVDYAAAAQWCLMGSRENVLDAGWRKLMIRKVILPLEKCCSYFNTPAGQAA